MPTFLIRKIIAPTLALLIAAISALPFTAFAQSDAAVANFKSIVTVKSYAETEPGWLNYSSQGSGVIISSDGLVLTNRHVVYFEEDLDGSQKPGAYQICIPKFLNAEPDCGYTADLIAVDKDLDIALLKIHPIEGLGSNPPYQSVSWNLNNLPKTNDEVVTLGYPSIGGKTLTVSHGSVAGVVSATGKTWLKIDAVSSFGSSGGAAMNAQGELIGITSAANSDYAGSLGYVVNMPSLAPWIESHRNLAATKSPYTARLEALTKTQNMLAVTNVYRHSTPPFTLTKPTSWSFTKNNEDIIFATNENDDEGGWMTVKIMRNGGEISIENFTERIRNSFAINGLSPVTQITQTTSAQLKGAKAYKIKIVSRGDTSNEVVVLSGDYVVVIDYSYGKDQKDQKIIDNMVTSMTFDKPLPPKKQPTTFSTSLRPKFNFKITNKWQALPLNSQSTPLILWNKKNPSTKVEFHIKKTNENTKGISNQDYIDQRKLSLNQNEKDIEADGLKIQMVDTNNSYKLSKDLKSVIMIDYKNYKKGSNTEFLYNRDYIIQTNEKIIRVSLYVSSPDKAVQAAALKDFNDLLKTLKVEGKK